MKKAWTLSELLVSTVIISIIFVVLAPMITKRFEEDIRSGSAQNDTRLFLYDTDDPDCTTESNNSLICKFSAPVGVKNINAIMVSGGGGGAGATNAGVAYDKIQTVTNTTATASVTKELDITSGLKNVKVNYLSGSGGGGGGGSWSGTESSAPTSQADCDKYDAKYLTPEQNGTSTGVCVTKYNVGDIPGAPNGGIATSVTTVQAASYRCEPKTCCWKGSYVSQYCNSSGTSYSGCGRTVCTWHAANTSCETLAYNGTKAGDWRLPTKNELSKWRSKNNAINKNQGDNGLRFCDAINDYGAPQCSSSIKCFGAGNNSSCYPSAIWSSSANSVGNYYRMNLSYGVFSSLDIDYPEYANSSRCVLEGAAPSNTSLSGGGGSSAPYFKNYTIPQDILDSNIGGKIVMFAAAGGAGGSSASAKDGNGSNGSNGSDSYIAIYDKDGTLKWGLKASGGNGGKGATSSAGGAGGAQKAANTCQIYQNGAWTATNCSGAGASGSSGQSVSGASETNAANGGIGGGSMYSSDSYSGGGTGGSASSVNGSKGSTWGSGGGGGTIGFDSSNNTKKGKGGNGANGVVELKYDVNYQAAAGGGGGGGSMAQISEIAVTGLKEYVVKVGGGGNGGSISAAGENGGESSISADSGVYIVQGGLGGGLGVAQSESSSVVQGVGGEGGSWSSNIKSSEVKKGKKGSDGTLVIGTFSVSAGGQGGESGIGIKGSCGGLFNNSSICVNNNVNGANVAQFEYPAGVFKAINYGSAGAGGGGGGWSFDSVSYPTPGAGAKGQNGYVYIYWTKN